MPDSHIFLWGVSDDSPLEAVHNVLLQEGVSVLFVNQEHALTTELDLFADAEIKGIARVQGETWDLDEVSAAYIRPYDSAELLEVGTDLEGSEDRAYAASIDESLFCWLDLTPALVLNRPSAMASNTSKPYQSLSIEACQFAIPETLITNDPEIAQEFWERHGTVIYKSISGVRSIVARVTADHVARLGDIKWCPTQFQQYIPGADYRVHVIGEQIFATRITSDADDYRYACRLGVDVNIEACELPESCVERCRTLTSALGLRMAGIDLRCADDGRWYCFEVNPSPAFTYYEQATDQPIAQAVVRLLMQGA
jgi:hypothetical protein